MTTVNNYCFRGPNQLYTRELKLKISAIWNKDYCDHIMKKIHNAKLRYELQFDSDKRWVGLIIYKTKFLKAAPAQKYLTVKLLKSFSADNEDFASLRNRVQKLAEYEKCQFIIAADSLPIPRDPTNSLISRVMQTFKDNNELLTVLKNDKESYIYVILSRQLNSTEEVKGVIFYKITDAKIVTITSRFIAKDAEQSDLFQKKINKEKKTLHPTL